MAAFSYAIHGTEAARSWDVNRRRAARVAVRRQVEAVGFEPTGFARRYQVPEVDDLPHARPSLVVLPSVLDAIERRAEPPAAATG